MGGRQRTCLVRATERHDQLHRDDLPAGLDDPRAEAGRTETVLDPSAVDVMYEAAGQRDALNRAGTRDKPDGLGGHPRDSTRPPR